MCKRWISKNSDWRLHSINFSINLGELNCVYRRVVHEPIECVEWAIGVQPCLCGAVYAMLSGVHHRCSPDDPPLDHRTAEWNALSGFLFQSKGIHSMDSFVHGKQFPINNITAWTEAMMPYQTIESHRAIGKPLHCRVSPDKNASRLNRTRTLGR